MTRNHSQFMQLAINKAWKYQLLTYPNPAVGSCVVRDGKVLSVEAHKEAGKPHAEVLALKAAYLTKYPQSPLKDVEDSHAIHNYLYENHNGFFKDCEIYVTLEPCNHMGKTPACAMLLENIAIKKVYIGTLDPNKKASGGLQRLQNASIEVEVGVCSEKTDELLLPFIKWQEKNLKFFKIAMREDGSVDGGYITTKDSLSLVHQIRTKLDLMVIGGNTVRIDRPTLDARYAKENISPDILIYSRKKESNQSKGFDKSIPLFSVKNRDVQISDSLNSIENKNFVMIEGGLTLLETIKDRCDYIVVFVSHKQKSEKVFDLDSFGFEKVHSYFINEYDEIVFLRK